MDPKTASVYIATGPSQHVTAFANSDCTPGTNNADVLGKTGGACVDLKKKFPDREIHSVLFYVKGICDVADFVSGVVEAYQQGP